ncbi:MAG: hypothetical protein ABFD54_12005 [Armatimonadota bacterium]|nr:hypothetical protein [bacterium]
MPNTFAQWISLFGIIGIGVLFVLEVRKWRSPGNVIGRKQRILRGCLVVLIELLFVLMLVSPWVTSRRDPIGELIYWMACIILAFIVVGLAALDMRMVAGQYASMHRRIYGKLRGDDKRGEQ